MSLHSSSHPAASTPTPSTPSPSTPATAPASATSASPASGAVEGAAPRVKVPTPPGPVDRRYRMTWNGKRIGWHRLTIRPADNGLGMHVLTEIEMQIKIGPITAFRFRHHAVEQWNNGALHSLETRTENDGETSVVRGRHTAAGLQLYGPRGSCLGPHGLLTSNGLWNKAIVGETQIIDAHRGEVVALAVAAQGCERLKAPHGPEATRFRFETPCWRGDLWYDHGDEWLRAVLTRNGQTLTLDRDS